MSHNSDLMWFAKLYNRIRPAMIPQSALLAVFFCCIILGCAYIPEQEQLVSAKVDESLIRSNGNCMETASVYGDQQIITPVEGLSPERIAILDWNIYKGQRMGWQSDFLRLSREKDIILLQEASLNDELQELLQERILFWNLNSAFRYKGVETGVLVASTIEPLGSCGMRQNEPVIGLPKTILINRYAIRGVSEKLLVANVHGINITLGVRAYRAQFQALGGMLQKHDGPILLAGDFNNWSEERIAVIDHLVEDLSLTVLPFAADEGRTLFFGDPVDHILFRGLEPVAHAVHPVISSDHNPISVTFRLVKTKDIIEN